MGTIPGPVIECSVGESVKSATVTGTTAGCTTLPGGPGAPYLYLGWGNCATPQALAGAYQEVISAHNLKAIDIENTDEFESEVVQDRILNALKIIKQNNPSVKTILTFGTTTTGPNFWGNRLITQAKALAAGVDVFTIMPFDFGGGADMFQNNGDFTRITAGF